MDNASAIRSTMDLYGFAVDSRQWDLFDEVFTPEVQVDAGGGGCWSSLATFKVDYAAWIKPYDVTRHAMSNVMFEIEGDHAYAITYASWFLLRRGTPGGDEISLHGWYNDTLVRGGRGWLICKRQPHIDRWSGNAAVLGENPSNGLSRMMDAASSMEMLAARRRRLSSP